MPLVAANGTSAPAIGLPALLALAPQSEFWWTSRWYLPALRPSNQPVEATETGPPSCWRKVTVAPLSLAPLTGVSWAWACQVLGGGGGGGSGAGGGSASAGLVSATGAG